jgi:effector-binding domain-containing protein
MTDPEIVELEAQPSVAVRLTQRMDELDLAAAFDQALPQVAARIGEGGGAFAGPPYGRYHRFGPDVVDVEIGFPVSAEPSGLRPVADVPEGEVGRSQLPGGPVARATHVGSYDGLSGTYDALHEWIHAQPGYDDGAGPWESYVDDIREATDLSTLRTEVIWPLERS